MNGIFLITVTWWFFFFFVFFFFFFLLLLLQKAHQLMLQRDCSPRPIVQP
jgi:hypothetical protein